MFSGSDRPCNSRDSAAPVPQTRGVVGTSRPGCLTEQPGLAAPRHGRQRGPMADHATGRTPSVGSAGADPRRGRRGTPAGRLRRPRSFPRERGYWGSHRLVSPVTVKRDPRRQSCSRSYTWNWRPGCSTVRPGIYRQRPNPLRSASDASRARASVRRRGPWARWLQSSARLPQLAVSAASRCCARS